jgi:hypothetical protein
MGISAWLDKQFASPVVQKDVEYLSTPPLPEPPKQPAEISEPVISLLAALKRDEWELCPCPTYGYGSKYAMVTNVFHEDITLTAAYPWRCQRNYQLLGNKWMTDDERTLVGKAVAHIAEVLEAIALGVQHARDRENFMVFVDKENK